MGETIRAFIAVELPADIRRHLAAMQREIGTSGLRVRWVRPDNIHLTLRFLGDIDAPAAEQVADRMRDIASSRAPFTLHTSGIGVFPGLARPRVLWSGVGDGVEPLRSLAGDLEKALTGIGFPKENRPFRGHLTIGRFKGSTDTERLKDAIRTMGGRRSDPFLVDRIVLFQSRLTPEAAVYTAIASAAFASAPPPG